MIDSNEFGALVEELFSPLVGSLDDPQLKKSLGLLIGITIDGSRYHYSLGQLSLHSNGALPAIQDIVVFIGSNSKVFTATLLALAAAKAKNAVTPDTPVTNLLPSRVSIQQPYGEILLWHLATHSAGFPKGVCGPRPVFGNYPFTSMGGFLDNFGPSYAPGQYWVYSNQGFALLGDVLSQAYTTGRNTSSDWDETYQNWPSVVMKHLVNPLGMTNTQVAHADVADKVLQGYNYTDPKGGPVTYTAVTPPHWVLTSAGLGAGALSSTMDDMLLFLEQQISPAKGDLGDAIRIAQQPWPSSDTLSMGLGWQRSNDYFDKDGGLGGYETYMAFDPDRKLGVFVAGNTSGGSAGGALSNAGRQLLGKIRRVPTEPSHFPHPDSVPQCPKQGATE